jgi:ribosomal protein S18 acetylase RimI-like enzyme
MKIRSASVKDFDELYSIGKSTPELQVSANEKFMDADEFRLAITDTDDVFLVAEEKGKITGFILAYGKDIHRPYKNKYGCIVYLVVLSEFRRKGIATKLYSECMERLKKMGLTHAYTWASAESKGEIVAFMEKQGFAKGHQYIWMDRKI